MRRKACVAVVWLSALAAALHAHAADASSPPVAAQGSLQAAFAPWDNIEELITDAIGGARKQVLVQAYLLTSKKIAYALIAAQRRGIDVRVLADAEQIGKTATSRVPDLAAAGVAVWLETRYQNAHNKIIVIDADTPSATVITGSYNFTWTAQHKNAENVLIVRKNPALATRYALNWERHRQDAVPYKK
jgi:phosphatidylserine/phosphatidylglycerophosphate/cardiolipin synthase-like enzyme